MFSLENAKQMAALYDRRNDEENPLSSTELELYHELGNAFYDNLVKLANTNALKQNRRCRNMLDHPQGMSFAIYPLKEELKIGVKLYTEIYIGDYKGINQRGYSDFHLPVTEELKAMLTPFFSKPFPNSQLVSAKYYEPWTPPETIWRFWEREFPTIDWMSYGTTAENPIRLTSVPQAYAYLKALEYYQSSVAFHRICSMSAGGRSNIDHWEVVIRFPKEKEDQSPFTVIDLYTWSYSPVGLLSVPPPGFTMNRTFSETNPFWQEPPVCEAPPPEDEIEDEIEFDSLDEIPGFLQGLMGSRGKPDRSKMLIEDMGGPEGIEAHTEKVKYLFEAWRPRFMDYLKKHPTFDTVKGCDTETLEYLSMQPPEEVYHMAYECYVAPWAYMEDGKLLLPALELRKKAAEALNITEDYLKTEISFLIDGLAEEGVFPLSEEEVEVKTLDELKAMFN